MLSRFGFVSRASRPLLARCGLQRGSLVFAAGYHASRHLRSDHVVNGAEIDTDNSIYITRKDKEGKNVRHHLPSFWLRDNCLCKDCVNQDTRQRNFDTFKLPADIQPVAFEQTPDHLLVTWSDSHKSEHPWSWVEAALPNGLAQQFGRDESRVTWTSAIADSPPRVSYDEVMTEGSNDGIAALTRNIWVHGFSFVVNTPATPEATESLLGKIGPIRTTHYGGFYDFIPDLALADTAYTNLALPAHTDTTYFTEPAGLQAFHLLSHTAPPNAKPTDDPLGGQSLLVDGFQAAFTLRREDPDAFTLLAKTPIPWHASGNKGIAIVPDKPYPVFEMDKTTLNRVRWNNDDRGVVGIAYASEWYKAAAKFNEILRRKESEYWFQLKPGTVVIFDNWRVMHGRSAFEGVRRICGGYTPRDDFVSRYRTTNFPIDAVIGRNLNMKPRKFHFSNKSSGGSKADAAS